MDFENFLQRIRRERMYESQRFCFVLGAGASRGCGVKAASDLIDDWYNELLQSHCLSSEWKTILQKPREEALNEAIAVLKRDDSLLKEVLSPTKWETDRIFTTADLIRIKFVENETEKYSRLFSAAYPSVGMRQNRIKEFTREGTPGKGHELLSRLLCETNNNVVITTNFDRLVEVAIQNSGHGNDLLLMSHCGDSSCSAFDERSDLNVAFQTQDKNVPLVIKAHGDVDRREQKNTIEELRQLPESFYKKLSAIFSIYKPIYIGYSGSDSGLVDFLLRYSTEVNRNPQCYGCYWLVYGDNKPHLEDTLPERARMYVQQVNGQCIAHNGFESAMEGIAEALFPRAEGLLQTKENQKIEPKYEIENIPQHANIETNQTIGTDAVQREFYLMNTMTQKR